MDYRSWKVWMIENYGFVFFSRYYWNNRITPRLAYRVLQVAEMLFNLGGEMWGEEYMFGFRALNIARSENRIAVQSVGYELGKEDCPEWAESGECPNCNN